MDELHGLAPLGLLFIEAITTEITVVLAMAFTTDLTTVFTLRLGRRAGLPDVPDATVE